MVSLLVGMALLAAAPAQHTAPVRGRARIAFRQPLWALPGPASSVGLDAFHVRRHRYFFTTEGEVAVAFGIEGQSWALSARSGIRPRLNLDGKRSDRWGVHLPLLLQYQFANNRPYTYDGRADDFLQHGVGGAGGIQVTRYFPVIDFNFRFLLDGVRYVSTRARYTPDGEVPTHMISFQFSAGISF